MFEFFSLSSFNPCRVSQTQSLVQKFRVTFAACTCDFVYGVFVFYL